MANENLPQLDLPERLRERAQRRRELAENANDYFHAHQRTTGWYNAVIKGEYEDRSDYASTLDECRELEEAADTIERLNRALQEAYKKLGPYAMVNLNG